MTSWQEKFEALGVNVAAMTYDAVDKLAEFGEDRDVAYPLLSDEGAKHVEAWGIRNEQHEPGDFAYGVGHPGVFVVDAQGAIRLKRAVEGYRDRPDFQELLQAVRSAFADDEGAAAGD